MQRRACLIAFVLAAISGASVAGEMITEGAPSVGPDGAAKYSIPIAVPPGIGGMQPKLSLEYSSNAPNGMAGIGWGVSGFSSITRCAATKASDGIQGGVNFLLTDRFCLDGEKLILMSGTYGAAGSTYRTERDSMSRVTAVGTAGNGPASFTVQTKSGITHQYGSTADSAIEAVGIATVRVWALNRSQDTVGNYMTVSYQEDTVNGDYVPDTISYTGNGSQSPASTVTFTYTARTDQLPQYIAGTLIKKTKLLDAIQTNVSGALVKKYQLAYATRTYATQMPMLQSVQERFATGTALPAIQVATPGYLNFASSCTSSCASPFASSPAISVQDPSQPGAGWQMFSADINVDGKSDLVAYTLSGNTLKVRSWVNNAGSFNALPVQQVSLGGPVISLQVLAGDMNADGRPDLVALGCRTSDGKLVASTMIGTGTGSFSAPSVAQEFSYGTGCPTDSFFRLVDTTGNGRSNVYWINTTSTALKLATLLNNGSNAFGSPSTLTPLPSHSAPSGFTTAKIRHPSYSMDVNNDGIQDVVLTYVSGNSIAVQYWPGQSNGQLGNAVTLFSTTNTPGNSGYSYENNYAIQLSDVNGDGQPDILAMASGTSGANVDIWINKGASTFATVQLNAISAPVGDISTWASAIADVDGDGYVDIVFAGANSSAGNRATYAFLGNGAGGFSQAYGTPSNTGSPPVSGNGWNITLGDINGKGRADVLAWSSAASGMFVQTWANAISQSPLLATSVTNGIGATSTFSYSTLGDSAVYTKGSASSSPIVNLAVPINVVSGLTMPNGIGGTTSQSYKYSGLRAQLASGRGVLGFAGMTTTQVRGSDTVAVNTTYSQSWPYTGLPLTVSKTISSAAGPGHQVSLLTNTYGCVNTKTGATTCSTSAGVTYFPYVLQSTEASWDLNGVALPTVVSTNTVDTYGNTTQTTVGTADGNSKQTNSTYTNDTTSWLLGRLTQSAVTSTSPSGTLTRTSAFTYSTTNGLLLSETVEPSLPQLCQTSTYTYDAYGNVATTAVANCPGATGDAVFAPRTSTNSTAATTNNPVAGQFVTSSTNALSHAETKDYDRRFGLVKSQTGPNALSTTRTYDERGRLTLETRADGNKTKTEYFYCAGVNAGTATCPTINGAAGAFVVVSTPLASNGTTQNGAYSKTYFDMLGRKLRVETQGFDGSTAIYQDTQYDSLGQVLASSRPYYAGATSYWSRYTYDAMGRVVGVIEADNAITTTAYNGLSSTVTNPNNQSTRTTKNSQGQIATVTDANNGTTTYAYDALGNLVSTTDVAANMIQLTYDLRGRKTQMVDPDMGTWTYTYDALGQLVKQVDANGATSTMLYDVLGRMTRRSEADLISNWYFDARYNNVACPKGVGKLCESRTDTGYIRVNSYDTYGRPSQTTTTIDTPYTETVTYDANGRLATKQFPGSVAVQYSYTNLGYLNQIARTPSNAVIWKPTVLDAEGHLLQQQHGNSVATTQTFNPANGRLTSITAGAGNAIQNATYSYDTLGNLTSRNDGTQALVETFTYDALNRMTSASVNASAASYTDTYNYAASGNIDSRSDVGSYAYRTVTAPAMLCANGTITGTGPSAVCTTTISAPANVTYQCQGNQVLQGTNCFDGTNVTPATPIYSCSAGATLTGSGASSTCVTMTSVSASQSYSCLANATLSGTNCVYSQTTTATANYSCISPKILSGTNCTEVVPVPAPVLRYDCPSGDWTLSGSTCVYTTSYAAQANFYCWSGFYPTYGWGSGQEILYLYGVNVCQIYTGWDVMNLVWPPGVFYYGEWGGGENPNPILARPADIAYSCPSGGELYGAGCYFNYYATPTAVYYCPSGTQQGSTCMVTTSVAANVNYSCPAGQTLAASNCINTTISAATPNYVCTTGTLVNGNQCQTSTSTAATITYSCDAGGILQGTNCLLANGQTVPATQTYTCSQGTVSGNMCTGTSVVAASAAYSCPAGQSVSGTFCIANGNVNNMAHAVSLLQAPAGAGSRVFNYDANGSRTSEAWQTGAAVTSSRLYAYTSFAMPSAMSATTSGATKSETYVYGTEHQRVKMVSTTLGTTNYVNPGSSGELSFERQIKPDNSIERRSFISAGGVVVAVIKELTTAANVQSEQTLYFHRDALSSVSVVTDLSGAVIERTSYEPFGKRREVAGQKDPNNLLTGLSGQRGFSNHEHLDELGLIHMNGRIYDPMTARFMSADPLIQAQYNSQSYNRYSYGFNGPFNGTDPTGYKFNFFRTVLSIAVMVMAPELAGAIGWTATASGVGTVTTGFAWSGLGISSVAVANGVVGGGLAGLISAGNLKGAVIGAVTGGAFGYVGDIARVGTLENTLGHAAVGCGSSMLSGSNCQTGAVSAGFSAAATPAVVTAFDGSRGFQLAAISAIGGTSTALGGGKFTNGAQTAAFGYLFNFISHEARARLIAAGAFLGGTSAAAVAAGCVAGTGGLCVAGAGPLVAGGIAAGMVTGEALANAWDQLDDLLSKSGNAGPDTVQYALVAERAGLYPTVGGNLVLLDANEVWKYGVTQDISGRYPSKALAVLGLRMDIQATGTRPQMYVTEKIKLIDYAISNGSLPPGNRIFK